MAHCRKEAWYVTDWRDHARSQLDTEYENSRPSAQSQRLESERIALVEILEDAQDADDPPHKPDNRLVVTSYGQRKFPPILPQIGGNPVRITEGLRQLAHKRN